MVALNIGGYTDKVVTSSVASRTVPSLHPLPPVPNNVLMSITRVLVKNSSGVAQSEFFCKYFETVGESIDTKKFRFPSLMSLLSSLESSLIEIDRSKADPMIKLVKIPSSKLKVGRLLEGSLGRAGWVNIVKK